MLLCGIASLFGASTVAINNRPVTCVMGLLVAIIAHPVLLLYFYFIDVALVRPQPVGLFLVPKDRA